MLVNYIETNVYICVISGLSQVSKLGEWDAGRQEKVHKYFRIPETWSGKLEGSLELPLKRGAV